MNEEEMRTDLGRWYGYGGRWRRAINDVLRCIAAPRSLAISAPPGAALGELAAWLRGAHSNRILIIRAHEAMEEAAVRATVQQHRVTVIAEGFRADDLQKIGATVTRIPAIAERREDLARLLGAARIEAEARLGVDRANISEDMAVLYKYEWAGHLDEIARVMRMVIALRGTGSLRSAASVLGMTKSTLANHMSAVGVQVRRHD